MRLSDVLDIPRIVHDSITGEILPDRRDRIADRRSPDINDEPILVPTDRREEKDTLMIVENIVRFFLRGDKITKYSGSLSARIAPEFWQVSHQESLSHRHWGTPEIFSAGIHIDDFHSSVASRHVLTFAKPRAYA